MGANQEPSCIKNSVRDDSGSLEVVHCEACMTEVPLSVAKSAEGLDYVHFFCGLNCLEKWQAQAQTKAKTAPRVK